jgi:hypothetical protein
MASAAASNFDTGDFAVANPSTCFANFGQLTNPCERAMMNCACPSAHLASPPLALVSFLFANPPTKSAHRSVRAGSPGVIVSPADFTSAPTHLDAQSRMASGSPDLQAFINSFASFLYCSRLG